MKTMKHFDLRRVLALLLVISMLLTGNVGLITAYAAADGDTCDGEDHTQGSAVSSQENIRVCSCDPAPVEGEGHGEGCAFYVAPAEPEKVCTCDPAPAEGEGHGDGCAFYVAPDDQEKRPTVDGDQVENGQLQAPGVSAAEDGGPVMTAAFYQTIDRENIKLELGSGVNRIENWEKDALQYLKLSLSGLGDLSEGEQYRLVISMDSAVSIQDFVGDKGYSWSSKTAFTANAAIPVNLNGTYQTNACTAVFDIAPEISEVDLPLTVEYDWAIWNQNKGAELGYSTEYLSTPAPLLTLELRKVSTDGAETAVNTLKLDGATAGTEGQKTSGYSSSLIGDSPASGLNASQTLKIRYAVNKDYLCQGYKIVISLPYYTHTDGKVYAMVFDESQDSFSVTGGKANIKKEYGIDPETGANTVTLTFPGIYYTSANFSHVGYRLPDVTELDQLRQTFDFTNGTITAYVGDAVIGSHSFSTKMYPSAAEIRAVKTQSGMASVVAGDHITFLSTFAIQNAGNGSISITPVSEVLNPACKLTVQLHAAGASNGERPMGNDSAVGNAVTITIDAPKAGPGFKVLSMSDRIIEKNELGRAVTVKVAKANLSSSASVTMVVQVKEGNGYADRVAVLDSVSGLTSSNGENTLTLKFNVGTAPGTYRLLFTVTDGNTVLKIPYNFVVID